KCSNIAKKAYSTFSLIILANHPLSFISIFNAVPLIRLNNKTSMIAATSNTPVINCLTVRPLEFFAINNPIKGAHEICHAQKKIVFLPNQSLSEKGVKVNDIGIIFEI